MAKSVKAANSMDSPASQFPVAQASSLASRSSLISLCLGACFVLLVLSGCGHSSEISGAINTTDFVIPSGDVVVAVADTTTNASRKIQIRRDALPRAGRERGVRVALRERYRQGAESCDVCGMVAADPICPEPHPVNRHDGHRSDARSAAEIPGPRLGRLPEPAIRNRPAAPA